ncbi:MAG: asparagine synthase (glutamine-hydrolyzing), partial [Ferruginibacter sp.]
LIQLTNCTLMCGIAGIISLKGFDPSTLKSMTDIIHHRGPDGEGYTLFSQKQIVLAGGDDTMPEAWVSSIDYKPTCHIDNVKGRYKLGFGHRRLAILDLSSDGRQPMCYENQRYWIVYNGEVYNFKEIREELVLLEYHFHSKTDTEVILAAYSKWGIDCLNRFNGMWAFVIYDIEKNTVFFARDRFGIKPLYYWVSPENDFYFASEIKQFTVLPGWAPKVNGQRAYDYLVYSITDHTEETLFEGVFQIPSGHYLIMAVDKIMSVPGQKIATIQWYDLTYKKYKDSFENAALEFNKLFKSAVDLHLRSDVPSGTALSGGLDSSAIVCEVNNIFQMQGIENMQKTFSSCNADEKYSEKKWIDIVVKYKASVEAHYVYPTPGEVFDSISKLTWTHDEPYQSQSAFLGYQVFKLAAENDVKVLLNGQGADEYLGGYGQFAIPRYNKMLKQLKFSRIFKDVKKSAEYKDVNYRHIWLNIFASTLPNKLRIWIGVKFGINTIIRKLIDTKILGASVSHPYHTIPVKYGNVREVSRHLTFFSTLPRYLKWEDRNSMANSVEARVPFLDHRLVEFCFSLPDDYLELNGETKRVLREGLKDILPESIKNRKDKKGFITPEERWVKLDCPDLFRKKIKEAVESSNGIIKPSAVDYFEDVVTGKIPFDYTYWRIIQFGEWIKLFKIKI